MKRIPQSLFLALFVFAFSGFAQTQPQPTAPEELWKEFSSTAGRFKAVFPGDPAETSQTIKSDVGKIERHAFTLEAGFARFVVSYSDFPIVLTDAGDVKNFLDHMHEGEVASSQGKLLSMAEIEIDGYPGREFIVETPNSKFRMKYYLVGQRFYQIAISTQSADLIASYIQKLEIGSANDAAAMARSMELFAAKFFDSFKLTGKPTTGEKTTPDSTIATTADGANQNATSPGKQRHDRRVKAIAVDRKGRALAVKKIDQGRAITKASPEYPAEARAAGVSGKVEVQVTISEKGQVIEAIAISGPELLRSAAEQAAKQWVFKPTTADGAPVKVQGLMTFNFTLQ